MTGSDIATLARSYTGDTAPYVPDDAAMIPLINAALYALQSIRPDAFFDASGAFQGVTELASIGGTVATLAGKWKQPLAENVAAQAFQAHGRNRDPERAQEYLSLFAATARAL